VVVKKQNIFSEINFKSHIIIWTIITVLLQIIDPFEGSFIKQFVAMGLMISAYMIAYYSQYLFTLNYLSRKKIAKFSLFTIVVFLVYLTIILLNFRFLFNQFIIGDKVDYNLLIDISFSCLFVFCIISIMAYGSYQNTLSKLKIKESYENEKIMLNKELGFYKNQFNPHITFNFLNYCYSFVNQKSPETADVIEIYSEMLRYTIHCKPDETVPLTEEVEYLSKFIFVKKQLTKGIFVNFDIKGDLNQKHILPRILITFVENAFKHGDTHCEENPIHITLETANNEIIFKVTNKKNSSKNKLLSTGIGQLNVKNQLELFYKDKYELVITEDSAEFYSITLKINLN
jgi:sensor histidine kinase YesM